MRNDYIVNYRTAALLEEAGTHKCVWTDESYIQARYHADKTWGPKGAAHLHTGSGTPLTIFHVPKKLRKYLTLPPNPHAEKVQFGNETQKPTPSLINANLRPMWCALGRSRREPTLPSILNCLRERLRS